MLEPEKFNNKYHQQLDETKLTIYIDHRLDLSGFEVYHLLRSDYDIQMELAEPNIVMGIVSFMDNENELNQLFDALSAISAKHFNLNKPFVPPILKQMSIPITRVYQFHMPTYPSGHWLFGFASKKFDPLKDADLDAWNALGLKTKYYNTDIHTGAFALPTFVKEMLDDATE